MNELDYISIATFMIGSLILARAGLLSLKRLRSAPDFPHREEMLWGAGWWPLVTFLVLLAPLLLWVTDLTAPNSVGFGVWFFLNWAFPWRYEGMGVEHTARQSGGTIDWRSFVRNKEAEFRSWWWRYLMPLLWGGLIVFGAYTMAKWSFLSQVPGI